MTESAAQIWAALREARLVVDEAWSDGSATGELARRLCHGLNKVWPSELWACFLPGGRCAVDERGRRRVDGESELEAALLIGGATARETLISVNTPSYGQVFCQPVCFKGRHWGWLVVADNASRSGLGADVLREFLRVCADRMALHLLADAAGAASSDGRDPLAAHLPEVASVIAHELNNCLNGMMLQLALAAQSVPDDVRRDTEVIQGLGQAAAAIVRKLQQVNPRDTTPAGPTDLNTVVASSTYSGESIARELHAELAPVQAAPQPLARLIALLVRSAHAGTGDRSVRVATLPTGAGAAVRIADNGPAIDESALAQTSGLFAELRPGLDELTWAVARQLARRAGGDVRAENVADGGVAVTVEFLAAQDPQRPVGGSASRGST